MRIHEAMERWDEGRITFDALVRMAEAFLATGGQWPISANPEPLLSLAFELHLPGVRESQQDLDRDQAIVLQALLLERQQEAWADQAEAVEEVERTLREERPSDDPV
jgi:hypothetical protein